MSMLWSFSEAITLINNKIKTTLFRSFNQVSHTFGYSWSSSSTAYDTNDNSWKGKTILCSRGIASFAKQRTAFTRAQSAILQSRAKYYSSTKLISQNLIL